MDRQKIITEDLELFLAKSSDIGVFIWLVIVVAIIAALIYIVFVLIQDIESVWKTKKKKRTKKAPPKMKR